MSNTHNPTHCNDCKKNNSSCKNKRLSSCGGFSICLSKLSEEMKKEYKEPQNEKQ